MGMMAYLGGGHHMFNKTYTTCQQVNSGMVAPRCCVDPVCGYQILSSFMIFIVLACVALCCGMTILISVYAAPAFTDCLFLAFVVTCFAMHVLPGPLLSLLKRQHNCHQPNSRKHIVIKAPIIKGARIFCHVHSN